MEPVISGTWYPADNRRIEAYREMNIFEALREGNLTGSASSPGHLMSDLTPLRSPGWRSAGFEQDSFPLAGLPALTSQVRRNEMSRPPSSPLKQAAVESSKNLVASGGSLVGGAIGAKIGGAHGAAKGAVVGSVVAPGPGTVIGGLIGGFIGAFVGTFIGAALTGD